MVLACWSAKGGSGTTVVAAALAGALSVGTPHGSLLVDLAGDVPDVLGQPVPPACGLASWLGGAALPDAAALAGLEVPTGHGVGLLPRGHGPFDLRHAHLFQALLAAEARPVVVDCGTLAPGGADELAAEVASTATRSLLVLRPCFLGLRRAVQSPLRPSAVVLVTEPGRALTARDVTGVLGVPVVAEVPVDAAVARAVDAGLLGGRAPRSLGRALRPLVEAA